ncbi:hypothetical protein CDAR_383421 [Caerostris darwini]|uniref:Uncharacterized protein n=1 Tax=Caerostris darwini TaxID=1538125 RepID=A0AAV4NWV8_9ARAC|nr:hypothetical protein CDAR_383421 [Caerostris darwini]
MVKTSVILLASGSSHFQMLNHLEVDSREESFSSNLPSSTQSFKRLGGKVLSSGSFRTTWKISWGLRSVLWKTRRVWDVCSRGFSGGFDMDIRGVG